MSYDLSHLLDFSVILIFWFESKGRCAFCILLVLSNHVDGSVVVTIYTLSFINFYIFMKSVLCQLKQSSKISLFCFRVLRVQVSVELRFHFELLASMRTKKVVSLEESHT